MSDCGVEDQMDVEQKAKLLLIAQGMSQASLESVGMESIVHLESAAMENTTAVYETAADLKVESLKPIETEYKHDQQDLAVEIQGEPMTEEALARTEDENVCHEDTIVLESEVKAENFETKVDEVEVEEVDTEDDDVFVDSSMVNVAEDSFIVEQEKQPEQPVILKPLAGETAQEYFARIKTHITKRDMADIIGLQGEFWMDFRAVVMRSLSFHRLPLDYALRILSKLTVFPREGQQIDRLLMAFGQRYHECNPGVFDSADTCYILTFAIVILNTAIWNKNVKESSPMRKEDFIRQIGCVDKGLTGITPAVIEAFYESVKRQRILGADLDADTHYEDGFFGNGNEFAAFHQEPDQPAYEVLVEYISEKVISQPEKEHFKDLLALFSQVYLPDELANSTDDDHETKVNKRALFWRHFKDRNWAAILDHYGMMVVKPKHIESVMSDPMHQEMRELLRSIGSKATTIQDFGRRGRRFNGQKMPMRSLSSACLQSSAPLYSFIREKVDLSTVDLRNLITKTDTDPYDGVDICDLYSLYLHSIKTCKGLKRTSKGEEVSVLSFPMETRFNLLADFTTSQGKLFPFLKHRMELPDGRSPITLMHGPTARQYTFTDKCFTEANLRHWKDGWFFLVMTPNGKKRQSRVKATHGRQSSATSSYWDVENRYMDIASAELWIYTKDDIKSVTKWIERCREMFPHEGEDLKAPLLTRKHSTCIRQKKRPPLPGMKAKVWQDDGLIEQRTSAPPLPAPSKKVPLANTISYIDRSYDKHPNVFNFAKTGSSDTNEVLEKEGEQHHVLVFDEFDVTLDLTKRLFLEQLMPEVAMNVKQQRVKNEESLQADLNLSQRQKWVTGMNLAAAMSTILYDTKRLLYSADVNGNWEHLLGFIREKCNDALFDVKRVELDKMSERRSACKEKRETFVPNEWEEWIESQGTFTAAVSWSDVQRILKKANACLIVRNIVATVLAIEALAQRARKFSESLLRESIFLICLKLVFLQYHTLKQQVSEEIKLETMKINQLELSIISNQFLQQCGKSPDDADDIISNPKKAMEALQVHMVPTVPVELSLLAADRRGTMCARNTRRDSTTHRPPIPDFFFTLKKEPRHACDMDDGDEAADFSRETSAPASPRSEARWALFGRSKTEKNLQKIKEQLAVEEKKIEWLRVEYEKWRVYTGVQSQLILGLEMEIFREHSK